MLDLGLAPAELGQSGPLLCQQAGVRQGDRSLVGQADQTGFGVAAELHRWPAFAGGGGDHAEELAAGDDRDDRRRAEAEARQGLLDERIAGRATPEAAGTDVGEHVGQLRSVAGADRELLDQRLQLGRPAVAGDRREALGAGVPEADAGPVGCDHAGHGVRDPRRDLFRRGQVGQGLGQLEEGTRGRVPASRLLQGGGGVQGGGRLPGVGHEQLAFLGEERLLLGVGGAEHAVPASGRGDIGHQPGAGVLQGFAPDQPLAQGGRLLLGEPLVVDLQRGRRGRPGGQQVPGSSHRMRRLGGDPGQDGGDVLDRHQVGRDRLELLESLGDRVKLVAQLGVLGPYPPAPRCRGRQLSRYRQAGAPWTWHSSCRTVAAGSPNTSGTSESSPSVYWQSSSSGA
jgi:hypothetical protein